MKYKFILFVLAGLIILGFIWNSKKYVYYTTYFNGYYFKVAGTEEQTYESVLETNGFPETTWEEEKKGSVILKYLKYGDGRLFVFKAIPNGNYTFCRVEVTSSDYLFGRKKIGVGTERKKIDQTYKNSYGSLIQDTLHKEIYHVEDGKCALQFYFDGEERVNKIIICNPDIYHSNNGWKSLYYQISKEADDSTEVTEGSSYTLYEKYFGLKQGELARSMNIKSADELGKEGFLNSHFGGITIDVGEGIYMQYSNTDSILEDMLPCGIIIESDNTELGFMGARAGMNFGEIQNNAYPAEVKKGYIYNEEIDVYYLEYFDEFYRYLYLSYNPEGSDSWLLVEKY